MKLIQKTTSNNIDIQQLSKDVALSPLLVSILVSRGIDTVQKIKSFVFGKEVNFYDPFLLKNMDKVVHRLNLAKDEKQIVIIYGDYDCDGVTSSAILKKTFDKVGIDSRVHIPKRDSGYGLNEKTIETLIEKHNPDLIISCDCGISAIREVDYALELGVDIIITDHHEPGATLPQCLVINPKQKDCQYPDKNLCGAGVALKVCQALAGIKAVDDCIDLAAIATIGDMVPLVDENRHIVRQGIQKLNSNQCNLGLKKLKESIGLDSKISSGDIGYKITPRINVCGRMGDAYKAFILLTSNDIEEINSTLEIITLDNDKRKTMCEQQFNQAKTLLATHNLLTKRAIVLVNTEWEKGLTGILAARLASEFCRPSFVLTGAKNNTLKGTARSIEGINLYDLLTYCKETLQEYGGHKQAAGFGLDISQVDNFTKKVDEYLSQFEQSIFLPIAKYDYLIDTKEITCETIQSLDILEPYGIGFERPVFCIQTNNIAIKDIKSLHTALTLDEKFTTMCFFHIDDYKFKTSHLKMTVELSIDIYGKKQVPKGICRSIEIRDIFIDDQLAIASSLLTNIRGIEHNNDYADNIDLWKKDIDQHKNNFTLPMSDQNRVSNIINTTSRITKIRNITLSQINELTNDIYGILIVCGNSISYQQVKSLQLNNICEKLFLYPRNCNNFSKIMVAPDFEQIELQHYNRIIFVETQYNMQAIELITSKMKTDIDIFVVQNTPYMPKIDMSREHFAILYQQLKYGSNFASKNFFEHMTKLQTSTASLQALILAYQIFTELDIIIPTLAQNFAYSIQNKKTELGLSKIYNYFVNIH